MADTRIQGFDPLMQMQQMMNPQGIPQKGSGEFEDLMQQAAGVLEAAKLSQGGAQARATATEKDAAADITRIGSTQKQSPVRDAATKPKPQEEKKQNIGQDDKQNARVTEDNAKQGKDLQKAADDAGRKLISEVSEKLDVAEEDVELAMETLGLTAISLLDPANLTALLTELSGESDPMVLVTDADLYQTLQELVTSAQEFSDEIGITPEQINELAVIPSPEAAAPGEDAPEVLPEEPADAPESFAKTLTETIGATNEAPAQAAAGEDEEPVRVELSRTDADGNVVSVEVTMDKGSVVAEQVNSGAQNEQGESHQRRDRESGHTQAPENLADHVVGELAGRMAEQQVDFSEIAAPEQTPGTQTQEMVEIVRQITEQIRVNIGADVTSMELTLHPASLGNVQLTVTQDAQGKMVAQFVVENETVRQAIESQVQTLQQRLDEQGTKIEAVEISLASHGFESNLNGNQTGQQADQQREEQFRAAGPRGTRRINLAELTEEEEQTEEERIAAEMMAANGNTVDYTA
ncbi:MAG: flagellar hook-length control protein FliK [Lachnospiraceae bacterium]|nr:flagellar hook-length control protein FliK [Lachnospiraceae bacterium]